MDQLSDWFDWILIDSPPVVPLADTSLWMRSADGILMVAREGTTRKRQLQRGLQELDQSKLLGVVLNSSSHTDHDNYYRRYGPAPAKSSVKAESTNTTWFSSNDRIESMRFEDQSNQLRSPCRLGSEYQG